MKALSILAFIAVAALVSGCTGIAPSGPSEGSVEAYCAVVEKHKDRYLSAMAATNSTDGLVNLLVAAGAIGDLKSMWTELAKVAPDDIKTDTETMKEAWDNAQEAAQNRDVFGALFNAVSNTGPGGRVNAYIATRCGSEYAPFGTGATTSPGSGGTSPLLDTTWTDEDGYQYRVVLLGPASYNPTVDIAGAKPGYALLEFRLTTTGTIYNLTPERNARIPGRMVAAAAWKDPTVCEELGNWDNADLPEPYCGRGWEIAASTTNLPVGGSQDFQASVGTISPLGVPESSVDALNGALANPDAWVITISDQPGRVPNVCISNVETLCGR